MSKNKQEVDFEIEEQVEVKVKKVKKKLPPWVIIPILLVVVGIVVVVALLVPSGEDASLEQVEYITVSKGEISQEYMTSGTVESKGEVTYYAPANVPVFALNVEVGQTVKAGDLLASFDVSDLETQYTQMQLNEQTVENSNADVYYQANKAAAASASSIAQLEKQLNEKRAELEALKVASQGSAGEIAKIAARIQELEQLKASNQNEQSSQKALKENAELELAKLSEADSRYAQLLDTATKATTRISELEIELRGIQTELDQLGNGEIPDTATQQYQIEQEISALENSIEDAKVAASNSASGVSQAQANNMAISEELAKIEGLTAKESLDLAKAGIVAKYDGVVKEVLIPVGSMATQGTPIVTIVSNNNVEVTLSVPTSDFDKVIEGNEAEIQLGSHKYKGVVESVDKIALLNEKGTPSIGAKVNITNPDDNIFIGVEAKVNLEVAKESNALKIPTSAINVSTDGDFVYVIEDGKAVKREIVLGIFDYEYSEVVEGLKDGDKVIFDATEEIENQSVVGVERQEDSL